MFRDVCQLASLPGAEPRFGCACCAPFDGCKPGTTGQQGDHVYFPRETLAGAFTRPGVEQRAMPMDGCEPHAENYGGMVVLEQRAGAFVLERYVSALNGTDCQAVRRTDGRDLLLCTRSDVHQGHGTTALFQWDLAAEDEQLLQREPLVFVSDDEVSGCWSELGSAVSSARMAAPRWERHAGRTQLFVDVETRVGRVTREYLARCQELQRLPEGARPEPALGPRSLLTSRREQLVFRFDGSRFVRR